MADGAAGEAAVDEALLAVALGKDADGCHAAAARAGAVARHTIVHMARVQAKGAMVAVAPAARDGSDEHMAVAAAERLFVIGALAAHGGPAAPLAG